MVTIRSTPEIFYFCRSTIHSLLGPQVEVTLDLTNGGLDGLAPGLRANVAYGENNTLGVFVGFETQKEDEDTGITGRMTFVRSW